MIDSLMDAFPELKVSTDESGNPRNPIEIYANQKEYKGTDDLIKTLRLSDVVSKYLQKGQSTGLSIEEWYELEKQVNYPPLMLKNIPAQTGKKPETKLVDVKAANTAQLLKEIFEKAKNASPNPRGRTSDGNSTVNLQQKESSATKKQAIGQHWNIPSGTTGS